MSDENVVVAETMEVVEEAPPAPAEETANKKIAVEKEQAGKVLVERYWKDSAGVVTREGETEMIAVRRFPEGAAPGSISTGLAITLDMGKYESAKVSVFVSMPCYWEEKEDALTEIKTFVGMKVNESIVKLKELRKKKKKE